ncbi:hypothetical protein QC763_123765 [Podospora pseudopauciseta]|uniref:Uncharacterized protein n=1 Tax=Podospora pseudopauciseta TaxID=2093780 RepID=A0ABR0I4D6_9PEZI|nr:hypothetical protein QC763_123765 [Podospora pseudopauciseta]
MHVAAWKPAIRSSIASRSRHSVPFSDMLSDCTRTGLADLQHTLSSTVATLERAQGTHTCQGPAVRIPFSRITQGSSTQHAATTVHLPYLHTAATAYTYTYMHICPHQKCRDAEAKQWRWWGFSVLLNRLRRRMGEAFLPLNVAMLLP